MIVMEKMESLLVGQEKSSIQNTAALYGLRKMETAVLK